MTGHVFRPKWRDRRTGEQRESPRWWISYVGFHEGKRTKIRENSHSTKRADAVRLLHQRLGDVASGKPIARDAAKVTFHDLTERLLDDYRLNNRPGLLRMHFAVRRLAETFNNSSALAITAARVDDYIKNRLRTCARATVQVELSALKRAFHLAVQQGMLTSAPYIRSLSISNARTGFFERSELDAVLAHLPEHLRGVVRVAYFTGWRTADELLPMMWKANVDFQNGEIRLEPGTTKNKEGRTFPFHLIPELRDVLYAQRAFVDQIEKKTGRYIPHVFVRLNGKPIRNMRVAWRNACRKAGLDGKLLHDFRRTAVRNLERAGVPRSVAMKLTGHKTEAVYRRYAIVSPADLAHGVEKLAALHAIEIPTPVKDGTKLEA